MKWRAQWLILSVMVAACAPVDSRSTRPDTHWYRSIVESDADRIAGFYDRLLQMKGNELAGELEAIRRSFESDQSDLNRLQLALLLSFPGSSFRDDNAALALLSPFLKDRGPENSTLRPLAIWLHMELLELRRSDDAFQLQAVKLKDEQRRTEALQQKLDAILDMEMKMIEREQSLPKKK